MSDFLLELGFEEIPPSQLQPVVEYIQSSFLNLMKSTALSYSALKVSSTPRRFFLLASSVQEKQEDLQVKKIGPAKKVAYDEQGNLTAAALGFLKKNHSKPEDLYIETTDKGEFIALNYVQMGKATPDILKDWIYELIPHLPFTKTMIWNESRMALARPLRWLCILWNEEIIPLEIAGVKSGNITFGNRYLGLNRPVKIDSPSVYLSTLQENAVLAERAYRKEKIIEQLDGLPLENGLQIIPDKQLIETVTDLVEYPTAVSASFQEKYLFLPDKIITSTISQNQKCFSVQTKDGKLSNKFIFISNGNPDFSEVIRKGNEKVVDARLADALWYFQEDTKQPLEAFVPQLKEVIFQSRLGTMADKTQRIEKITEYICFLLHLDTQQKELALRTALLCKADLVTNMLGEKEFTKLQGYIGKQYALAGGEPYEVAEGIYEHYMPRGPNDSLPQTLSGAIVAVADKMDSVCGIIGIGLIPTGSADPFAIRRAANGVVQIIADREWHFNLFSLIHYTLELLKNYTQLTTTAEQDVQDFFHQRVEWLLKQLKLDYDVIDSLEHLALNDIPDLIQRAKALQAYRAEEDFIRLVIGFKRVSNIINGEKEFVPLKEDLFQQEEEKILYSELLKLRDKIDLCLRESDYKGAIRLLIDYGVFIDNFFDAVLVNCDEPELRANRYALLKEIKNEFLRIADISRLVVETNKNEN